MLIKFNSIASIILFSFVFFEPASASIAQLGASLMAPTAKQSSIVENVQHKPTVEEQARQHVLSCQRKLAICRRGFNRNYPPPRDCNQYLKRQGC